MKYNDNNQTESEYIQKYKINLFYFLKDDGGSLLFKLLSIKLEMSFKIV